MITFCDRAKVAENQASDYTNKALSELQSYIETLPNSNRKRKLIKKVFIHFLRYKLFSDTSSFVIVEIFSGTCDIQRLV